MKRLLWLLAFLPAFAFGQAQGPYGIFGGPIPSTSLAPARQVPENTYAFTTDMGLMVDNGSAWVTLSGGSMTYPGAGIANSTGSAWGTSYGTSGSGTTLALTTSPVFTTPNLGTPSAATLTNATGLPLSTGVTGLLPVANGGTGTASPGLVAGTNVTVTGSWPNQTINSSGGSGSPGTPSYGIQVNNGSGSFGGIALPGSTGYYTLNYSSLSAAPTLALLDFSQVGSATNAGNLYTSGFIGPTGGGNVSASEGNGVAWPTSCTGFAGWSVSGTPNCITPSGAITVSSGQAFTQQLINAQGTPSGNAYTVQTTDWSNLITFDDASAVAVTLPAATTTGFGVGYYTYIHNYGAGTATVTAGGSETIGGAASLAIAQNLDCKLISNGAGYDVGPCAAVAGGGSSETKAPVMLYVASVAQATTDYCGPISCGATNSAVQAITPISGSLKNLYVHVNVAPASGQTFQFTIFTGTSGASLSASALTCTISNPATSCSDITHNPTVTAANSWNLQVITSTTSGSAADVQASFEYDNP